jgi:eukaryotic-like serine/threonine-protein kinase
MARARRSSEGRTRAGGGGARLIPGLAVRAGQTLAGKYRVEELLGSGASGIVLSARNIHLRERVTLKLLASYTDGQEKVTARRLAKARLASRLRGAHVARIVDIGATEDGMPYVATQLLDGTTLEAELAERGRLEVDEAVRWVLEACEGLAEAHAVGLIHGDLKPQNIFLAEPPKVRRAGAAPGGDMEPRDGRVLKLLDFGTTSPLDTIGDQSASAFFGSPAFLAPEQIQDPESVDPRADVWALGVLLYHIISGSLPFEADTVSGVIVAVVYDVPALLTDAPYELARIVSRCLEKDRSLRPANVEELAAALAPFAGSEGARLSERVRAMLAAPPLPGLREAALRPPGRSSQASSVSPVAIPNGAEDGEAAPLLLVMRRAARFVSRDENATRPARRVVARRRELQKRVGVVALVATALGVAIAVARAGPPPPPVLIEDSTESIDEAAQATSRGRATTVVPPYLPGTVPGIAPFVTSTIAELPDAPPWLSFGAATAADATPTPLVVRPTPLASDVLIGPPVAAPTSPRVVVPGELPNVTQPVAPRRTTPRPAPRRAVPRGTAPPTSRLPAGLPTTREASPRGAAPPPSGAHGLISERK